MSAREVIGEVWQAGCGDAHETTVTQKLTLGAAVGALALEWSGTEASLIAVSDAMLGATHNPTFTALATGATSFAEQAVLGLITVASIQNFPGAFAAVRAGRERRRERKAAQDTVALTLESPAETAPSPTAELQATEQPAHKRLGIMRRFADAFGFGTSLNALIKNSSEAYSGTQNVKNVITDAGLIGLGVTALFEVGTEAFSEPVATEVLSSPWTYAGVVTLMVGSRVLDNLRKPKGADSLAQPQ